MSDPQTSRSELPIVPALVVSSLLGGLIALGLSSLWRFAMPGAANPPETTTAAPAVAMSSFGPAEFVEFLPPLTPQEQRIEEALEKLTSCDVVDTPLVDVVAFLAEQASLRILIDVDALVQEGIAIDSPVTRKFDQLRLRSVLGLILQPLQLTALPKDDVLMVTTLAKAPTIFNVRTYPVTDLCRSPDFVGLDFESLMFLLETETSGPWLNRDGEGGTFTELTSAGSLSVRQSYQCSFRTTRRIRSRPLRILYCVW